MSKFSWPMSLAIACIFWGVEILAHQHHLSELIPALGAYLLAYGVAILAIFIVSEWRKW